MSDLKWSEVKSVVRHDRSASAPGSSGITDVVLKLPEAATPAVEITSKCRAQHGHPR